MAAADGGSAVDASADSPPSLDADGVADIDWHALDDHASRPQDASADRKPDHGRLLEPGAPLDPSRAGVDVALLHPDRFTPAPPDLQRTLEAAYRLEPTPETLVERINPGVWSDDPAARAGRTTNCAACARAFQEGLEGRPQVAAAIHPDGLAGRGDGPASGEIIDYTEQWAGQRAEALTYAEVARRVRAGGGSAILLGFGAEGGHAFNAFWDDARVTVRWADAQVGITGDWPPSDLAERFPDLQAIVFDRRRRP